MNADELIFRTGFDCVGSMQNAPIGSSLRQSMIVSYEGRLQKEHVKYG